jgi:hypothetical protein
VAAALRSRVPMGASDVTHHFVRSTETQAALAAVLWALRSAFAALAAALLAALTFALVSAPDFAVAVIGVVPSFAVLSLANFTFARSFAFLRFSGFGRVITRLLVSRVTVSAVSAFTMRARLITWLCASSEIAVSVWVGLGCPGRGSSSRSCADPWLKASPLSP